jgi:integrase
VCRITASGTRNFIFEARMKGRPRRLTIGRWPELNLIQARARAAEIRAAIARGADPANEAAQARSEATFTELAADYLERHAKPRKRTWQQDEWALTHCIPMSWRGRRLSDISRSDVARLHAKIGAENGHYAANRTLALLRTMFNLARNWGVFSGDNPASGIKGFAERKRQRYLSVEELAAVNRALLDEPDWRWRAYFPLALMLGTRKSELLAMRWCEIDFAARTWRIPETKSGNSHLLPLPEPVLALLSELPSRGTSEFVFPGGGASGHVVEAGKAWERIREAAGVKDVRIHDLRHTLASWLVGQGYGLPLIGRALNHSQVSTTQRYAHLALDPVRAALEHTAALMTKTTVAEPDTSR